MICNHGVDLSVHWSCIDCLIESIKLVYKLCEKGGNKSMKFNLVIKNGLETIIEVKGRVDIPKEALTVAEMERIPSVEQLLEKLTGFRFHIMEGDQ